jgi:hypothetical protein
MNKSVVRRTFAGLAIGAALSVGGLATGAGLANAGAADDAVELADLSDLGKAQDPAIGANPS